MTLRRRKWYDYSVKIFAFLPVASTEESVRFAVWGMIRWASGEDSSIRIYMV